MEALRNADEIRDVNTRYHDVAAEHYDAKWGIDFGEIGLHQVTAKVAKALAGKPGHYRRSLEIGSGTGYFTLNLMKAGIVEQATCTDISAGMLATLAANAKRLGLTDVTTGRHAINAVPYDGRPGTIQDGFTITGDKHGARWSALNVEIPRAASTETVNAVPKLVVFFSEKTGQALGLR